MDARSALASRGTVLVALTSVLVGCALPRVAAEDSTSSASEHVDADRVAVGLMSPSTRDQEVLDVVLQDAISASGKHPAFYRPLDVLVVRPASKSLKPKVDYLLRHYRESDWARFPPAAVASLKVAALDLVQRASFDSIDLASADPRIRFVAPGSEDTGHRYGTPRIEVFSPGYGLDCELAIVHFVIPKMLDFGDATYVLVRSATGWDIVVRQVIFHP